MRSFVCLSLGAAVILLLVLASAMEAGAIRLDAGTRASVSGGSNQTATDKPTMNNVVDVVKASAGSTSETKKSVDVATGEVRAVAHKMPEFHEDYYGPSDHSPRHH
ncbi:hypothetical protein CFC21_085066 [Triticum aestivum]|uniref:Uncharacterized protein n=4 Tax=Triticum TaxID=4564 RepID=M7YX21_TRIUA|nr:uncharacterized protein LOC119318656 [Triticum dicoccoides]XP_044406872.1 uncharacterized protein LOC123131214 [Triticum aestivum]XP_048534243.1 uncharacterized protein LOC125513233 [Triticum urartu]VAI50855.1 unnamed protein product [Triticum turgidum subsp. durum]EMS52182.1 hypothetical protein TRIUR3_03128 [Triticum urartu]KAF7081093.1 hypothetical protein CFC21_085066 [Triticum aestivum]